MIPVRRIGWQKPLFLLPGLLGEEGIGWQFPPFLGKSRPIYLLSRAQNSTGYETDLVQMGRQHARDIVAKQPRGPYYLAGYSFGAQVAFHTAVALEQGGYDVAFVGILDEDADVHRRVFNIHSRTPDVSDVVASGRHAVNSNGLQRYGGKVTLFRARYWSTWRAPPPALDWDYLCDGGVDVYNFNCTHLDMPSPLIVRVWAPILKQAMNAARRAFPARERTKPEFFPTKRKEVPDAAIDAFRQAQNGDLEREIALYQEALTQNPDCPGWVRVNLANALLYGKSDPDRAAIVLRPCLDQDNAALPQNVVMLNCLADAGRTDDLEAFVEFCRHQPNETASQWLTLGVVLLWAQKLEEAETAFRKAIAIEPNRTDAYKRLYDLLRNQKRSQEAEDLVQIAIDSGQDAVFLSVLLGESLLARGAYSDAKKRFSHVLEQEHMNARAIVGYCKSMVGLGDLSLARAKAETMLERDPRQHRLCEFLASVCVKQNDFENAETFLLEAIRLVADHLPAWSDLAVLYNENGRDEDLKALISRAPAKVANSYRFKAASGQV